VEISFSFTDGFLLFFRFLQMLGFGRSIFAKKRLTTCPPAVKLEL
jgi:hypothetical protein